MYILVIYSQQACVDDLPVVDSVGHKGNGSNNTDVKCEKRHGTPRVLLPAVLWNCIAQVLQGKGRGCSQLHGVWLWI